MIELPHLNRFLSNFMLYLANKGEEEQLPSLSEISQALDISLPLVREQMEVARSLGLIEVRTKRGIKKLPYTFKPALELSLAYAVSNDQKNFDLYADLRSHLEESYWYEAVSKLQDEDKNDLKLIISRAKEKLAHKPLVVPHVEHRELHMTIYKRILNPFVKGILETYWDIYEAIGLGVYEDESYLLQVWNYHERMVNAIIKMEFSEGYQSMVSHLDLIHQRKQSIQKGKFE